ncbi:MAG: alpha/beta fold hydrolase [Phenylobacterium sp.]
MTRLRKVLIAGLAMAGVLVAASHVLAAKPAQTRSFTRAGPKGQVSISARVRGSGPLVVLVPSLGRGGADFDELATRLAQAGFTAASLDPRGVGQSRGPMEGVTLFDYAEDAAMVARGLSDKPAVFIGHAYGNRVVRALASSHPEAVSGLILLAAGGQVAMAPDVKQALDDVFVETLGPAEHLAAVRKAFFAPGNDATAWTGGWYPPVAKAQTKANLATPSGAWAGGGQGPILIVQAADDPVATPANAETLKQSYPDRVTVVTIPQASHAMLPEQPQLIADIVIGYLRRR